MPRAVTKELPVPRGNVVVRVPGPGDTAAVLQMWDELRSGSGRSGPLAPPASQASLDRLMAEVAADQSYRAVVAELDGTVVGMACYIARPIGPFVQASVVQIDYLHVRPAFHRRGVGRALLAASAAYAEESGAEHVVVNVFPQVREANRFYAKLGFSPMVVRRVVSVGTLRRRLGGAALDGVEIGRRAGILARRRTALGRARASTPA
jgi:GNAT superfamily N-acetyltransferase